MSGAFAFLGSRLFLSLLGTAALALLVWFLGPLIGFAGSEPLAGAGVRLAVILVLFAIWALVQILSALRARSRNKRLMEGIAGGEPGPADAARLASEEELATLRERFERALAVLKRGEGKKRLGGQWVYQLPWYLIIGPPGCGKTTALVSSGLRFPLAEELGQTAVGGFGGTRNCDWWFTDQAVILDTAGRYTTQDSTREVDSAAWAGFLALLKKYRPRRPINGVLVAVSVSDLLQQTPEEREAHARAIGSRVQELYTAFKIRCPVYAVFMKADLVAGFTEYFADLDREGREQVWGTTFPFEDGRRTRAADDPLAGGAGERSLSGDYAREHRALVERLEQRLLARMQAERDGGKRALAFSFPRQIAALGEVVGGFLDSAFAATRFEERPLVRGVYFTSGTQTGTPIDRVLGTIAANLGLGRRGPMPFAGSPKSFFVTRLFKEVVFPEAALAGLDPRLERRRLWLRRGAYAGVAALAVLATLAWTASYLRNRAYVEEVAGAVHTVDSEIAALDRSRDRDPLALLPLLDAARTVPGGYADRGRAVPVSMGLGLYQGDKLGSQARIGYRRLLEKTLLPRTILRLEEQIRAAGADPDALYEALRIYLMLDPAQADRYDPKAIAEWVVRDWDATLPRATPNEQRAALAGHLDALLEERPVPLPLDLDGDLIDKSRAILNDSPLAARLYSRMQREGLKASPPGGLLPVAIAPKAGGAGGGAGAVPGAGGAAFPDFTLAAAAGDLSRLVLTRKSGLPLTQGIPALYTYQGYHEGFAPTLARLLAQADAEAWVLGPESQVAPGTPESARLVAEVRRRYLEDYAERWQALLDDVALVPARDIRHAAEVARILADPKDSPMRRLLAAAADQTELDRPPVPAPAQAQTPGAAGATPAQAAGLVAGRVLQDLGGIVGSLRYSYDRYLGDLKLAPQPGAAAGTGDAPERYVSQRFAWLRDLVRGTPERPAPIDAVQQELAQLQLQLNALATAEQTGLGGLAGGEGQDVQALKQTAARLPKPVGDLMAALAADSQTLIAGGTRARLNTLWSSKVLPFCREAIAGRYPFEPGSARDTTLQDFGRLFGPGGLLDSFFTENLARYVNTSGRTWRWAGADLGIPDSVLAQFQRAADIREAFFAAGGKLPGASFELTPIRMDATLTQTIVDVGGQIFDYRHGPLKPQAMQWPAPDNIPRARVTMTSVDGQEASLTEDGAWAWFRLLDRSRLVPTAQEELFRVRFAVQGRTAEVELRAASVRNPFQLSGLRELRCPDRL